MQFIKGLENQNSINGKQTLGESIEKKSMHPDDFAAHLAWVIAKRSHDIVLGKTFAENVPIYRRIIG
jgi:hypothetical protein